MRAWLLLSLCLLARPQVAAGQLAQRGPALNWVRLPGAETCITASELAQRVEARLERSVFVLAQDAELSFDAALQPRALGGFVAHLSMSNERGEVLGARVVESGEPDCRALDDALVLITALTLFPGHFGAQSGITLDADTNARLQALFGDEPSELDPGELPAAVAPPPAVASEPAPAPQEPQQSPARPSKGRADYPRKLVSVEAAPVVAFGVLPGLALGMTGELTLRLEELWPLRVGFAHFFERDARAEQLPAAVGHFERNELTLFACPFAPDAAIALELCAGAAVGWMRVRSEGFAEGAIDSADPVLDLGGQAGLRFRFLDALTARLEFTALFPLVQRTYEFQALDASTAQLFRSAQVGLRLQIGIGAQF